MVETRSERLFKKFEEQINDINERVPKLVEQQRLNPTFANVTLKLFNRTYNWAAANKPFTLNSIVETDKQIAIDPSEPPIFLILLAKTVMPHEEREWMLGDMCERYKKDLQKHNTGAAKRKLFLDILCFLLTLIKNDCRCKATKALEYLGVSKKIQK